MLQQNLLYTAVTRGRRLVILVGSRRALKPSRTNRERQAAQYPIGLAGSGKLASFLGTWLLNGNLHPQ